MFFTDLSATIIQDDVFERLTTLPNAVNTGHQAFLTHEALQQIAAVTLANVSNFEMGQLNFENVVPYDGNAQSAA